MAFEITVDNMLKFLSDRVKEKHFMSATQWVDTAQKLNVLIGEEHDKLFLMEQEVAKLKCSYLDGGDSVAFAKTKVEATDLYRDMQKQRAKIKQVEEMIRIAKTQARLKENEYQNQ